MVNVLLKAKAPIDAMGRQAHDAYRIAATTLKSNIDKLAATGLPIVISELDIPDANDASQQRLPCRTSSLCSGPHPKVIGITYWGYVVGSTWKTGTGLLNTNGTERPALTWLKSYVQSNPNPPNDFPDFLKRNVGVSSENKSVAPGRLRVLSCIMPFVWKCPATGTRDG